MPVARNVSLIHDFKRFRGTSDVCGRSGLRGISDQNVTDGDVRLLGLSRCITSQRLHRQYVKLIANVIVHCELTVFALTDFEPDGPPSPDILRQFKAKKSGI